MKHWGKKFINALSGVVVGMHGQSSFVVHLVMAILVCLAAWWLDSKVWQWCVLLLCIAMVISLELLNSAIEYLAKGLCHDHNEQVGKALDIASGAVLVASCLAAIIGLIILGVPLLSQFLASTGPP